jgi:hypothetical protein
VLSPRVDRVYALERIVSGHNWAHIFNELEQGVPAHKIERDKQTPPQLMGLAWAFLLANGTEKGESPLGVLRQSAKNHLVVVSPSNDVSGLQHHFRRVHSAPGLRSSAPNPFVRQWEGIQRLKPEPDMVLVPKPADANGTSSGLSSIANDTFEPVIEENNFSYADRLRHLYNMPMVMNVWVPSAGEIPVVDFENRYCRSSGDWRAFVRQIEMCSDDVMTAFGCQFDVKKMRSTGKIIFTDQQPTFLDHVRDQVPLFSLLNQCRVFPGADVYGRIVPMGGVFQNRTTQGVLADILYRQLMAKEWFQLGDNAPDIQKDCLAAAIRSAADAVQYLGLECGR